MPQMTGAEALVKSLEAEGVDTLFALPGVQIMAIFDALHASPAINLITTRHEQGAAYMADGYARVSKKPGVALVVPGPGALNATAAVGTAFAASSPVLLISGQIPSASLGRSEGQLHEVDDQLDVFKPITKWNTRVTGVGEIPSAVHEAFRQMTTGRPRPVELEVPPDILAATGEVDLIEAERYPVIEPGDDDLARAAAALAGAERPAMAIGGGTLRAGAEVVELAELLGAPVLGTQQSKGVMPPDHPLCVGVQYAGVGVGVELLGGSDVILAVGTRFLIPGFRASGDQTLIKIDIDPDELAKDHGARITIQADARATLRALVSALRRLGRAPAGAGGNARAEAFGRQYREYLRRIAPEQMAWVQAVREAASPDAVFVAGVTNTGYWSNLGFDVPPEGGFISSGYFGNLGYAFPTALGAKVAAGSRQVVAVCGDGGFMYSPQELATARQYGINLVAVVFDNGAFGASRWDQRHRYGDRAIGTELLNPDWDTLAAAFGVRSMSVGSPGELRSALSEALAADEPVLIHAHVEVLMPPFQIVGQ